MVSENAECVKPYRGVVFSGRGEGSFYVSIYTKQFRTALGITPYPGTLNVRLLDRESIDEFNSCLEYTSKIVIEPPQVEGSKLARVIVYPIYVNGVKVWVVRPEITIYKNDVVELISNRYLRELLKVKDGDIVYLSFSYKQEEL
jgi:riboflavin kinase